jgi:hypothetical protein
MSDDEYYWVSVSWYTGHAGVCEAFKLTRGRTNPQSHGTLVRGNKANPGWHIMPPGVYTTENPITVLPARTSRADAKAAAKVIILSVSPV